ncbi:hypothetical protein GP486_005435 [Trichoglossum hirsutum]|uniref:Swiss Army Knife RNA repair protein HAD domain-containing protein n=1 Tax=Trichoglossum hirsutum TaxID=265104 RepID=A0A9P8L994_9PEZI|nr:hypothetical protein GP486_005435 [Trichoglossum hirsutum]
MSMPRAANLFGRKASWRTLTGLKRWSCQSGDLPAVQQIKTIHVYDFDNTLFNSPLPNPKLWNESTIGHLYEVQHFVNGGWWHDSRILAATGEGIEKEEERAWEGWWNEQVASLVKLSMKQKDALTVLLTGRSERIFADLIKKMVASKKLEFDIISLKPEVGPNNQRFQSNFPLSSQSLQETMFTRWGPGTSKFKQAFLEDLVYTYKDAEDIRLYEDRPKHVRGFREFFTLFNKVQMDGEHPQTRGPITAEVIPVAEGNTTLDPVTEVAEVQRMINDHNMAHSRSGAMANRLQIKRTTVYTGCLIDPTTTEKLLNLVQLPPSTADGEIKLLANNILMTPSRPPKSVLDRVGGIGAKMSWEVVGSGALENKIWAALLKPISETAKLYAENRQPIVVLARRYNARPTEVNKIQNWQPVPEDKSYCFEAVVGEKLLLRVETENPDETECDSFFPPKNPKRKQPQEPEGAPTGPNAPIDGNTSNAIAHRQHHPPRGRGGYRGGRGGSGGGYRGNPRGGGGGRGRGRGSYQYRSLDDVNERTYIGGYQNNYQGHGNDEYQAGYHGYGGGPNLSFNNQSGYSGGLPYSGY